VARNVAENLVQLGAQTSLITAFGDDHFGQQLRRECEATGIDVTESLQLQGVGGSLYLAILDDRGDMAVALSDMRAIDSLTSEWIVARTKALRIADCAVLDTNVTEDVLIAACTLAAGPVVLDTVSVHKAARARSVLDRLAVLRTNVLEAGALLGRHLDPGDVLSLTAAVEELREMGPALVYLTAGSRGVWLAEADRVSFHEAPKVDVINVTGAGDAFTAGVAYAIATGLDATAGVRLASKMAAYTLECEATVSHAISSVSIEVDGGCPR
jgi:pseudouridine kinase